MHSQHVHRIVLPTPEAVAVAARNWVVSQIISTLFHRERCLVALSGGSTPRRLYELLAELPEGLIAWERVHLFWGDERNVPHDNPESNYRMVHEALLCKLHHNRPMVHSIPAGDRPAAQAAMDYERTLRSIAGNRPFMFDIVLLGLGDDAHTASLFPETEAIKVSNRWVIENDIAKLDTTRITLTAPILNASRNTAFLVCGKNKRWALGKAQSTDRDPEQYPVQLIAPFGDLWWFLDEAASGDHAVVDVD